MKQRKVGKNSIYKGTDAYFRKWLVQYKPMQDAGAEMKLERRVGNQVEENLQHYCGALWFILDNKYAKCFGRTVCVCVCVVCVSEKNREKEMEWRISTREPVM